MIAQLLLLATLSAAPVDSCAWVRAENDGSGAGFVVDADKRWLVTCRHVVADRDAVDVYFPWRRDGELVTEKSEYLANRVKLRERGLLVTGKVLKRSDAADLALVELESQPAGVKAIPLATSAVQLGDPLRVVGHRLDLDTLFNSTLGPARQTGRLANGYSWRGKKLAVNADAILGQLPIEEGDSGGPATNARGELVGMVSALRRQSPTAAVVITVAEIRKFLAIEEPKAAPTPAGIGDTLTRATVWVRPTATDFHAAGALIEKNLILTAARSVGTTDRVGIAFPLREGEKWIGEREPYRDAVGLHLKGAWRTGTVIARDVGRDLALIRVDSVPASARPIPLAANLLAPGDAVHAMSHPSGVEFAWVYAAGSVRQRGRVALAEGDKAPRVDANLLQLPAQAGSPGGPILNDRGELLGVLSARESAQQTGYAATTDEIARFLDVALVDRAPRTVDGLIARVNVLPERFLAALAEAFTARGTHQLLTGEPNEAKSAYLAALALDSRCTAAHSCLAALALNAGNADAALQQLDRGAASGRFNVSLLLFRAKLAIERKDWRPARGDLDRILDVHPTDAVARRMLVGVLLELNKDDEAAAAVGDAIRSHPQGLGFVAADLLAQAEAMEKKFPGTPSLPAAWLKRALTGAHKFAVDDETKRGLAALFEQVDAAKDDAERLAILRSFVAARVKK